MELRRYLRLIQRRMVLVIVAIIVGAGVGYLTTSRTPSYTATATIYVGNLNIAENPVDLYAQAGLNQVVATYAQMIPSPVIAQRAIGNTHLRRFSGEVAAATVATVVTGTDLIDVSVTDADPTDAVRLANGVSTAFVSQVSHYQATSSTTQGVTPNEPAYVFQQASIAQKSSTGLVKKIGLGAAFGLIIAFLIILLLDYLDITIKSPEELERRVDLPVLGIIPFLTSLPPANRPSVAAPRRAFGDGSG